MQATRQVSNERRNIKHGELRQKVLSHYDGKCMCCEEPEPTFLTIDHIGGLGQLHRQEIGTTSSVALIKWIIKNQFPPGLQVLCFNCNLAKGLYGECPHSAGFIPRVLSTESAHHKRIRLAVMQAYGGKCSCCSENQYEFLAMDHIAGGGNIHRRKFQSSQAFYRYLRDGHPSGFRILCHNCNFGFSRLGCCPHQEKREIAV